MHTTPRGEWIYLMINWCSCFAIFISLLCSSSIFLLSPCVCVQYMPIFPPGFPLYISWGLRCAHILMSQSLFCSRTRWLIWLCRFCSEPVAPSRACLCLKWKWHRGRCCSALQLKLNRHGRTFFFFLIFYFLFFLFFPILPTISTVHLPHPSNVLTSSFLLYLVATQTKCHLDSTAIEHLIIQSDFKMNK